MMIKELLDETPERDIWVNDLLVKSKIGFYFLDGFSVKNDCVTALFVRKRSNVDIDNWNHEEILNSIQKDGESLIAKVNLANALRVPIYLVVWHDIVKINLFQISTQNSIAIKEIEKFHSCKEFAAWLSQFKGIEVKKPFIKGKRLSDLDICLREHKVPWAGNLDGFMMDNTKPKAIFEYANTEVIPIEKHDLNLFMKQDFNRWKPFDILRIKLSVPFYIITWTSKKRIVKLQKVKDITKTNLSFESTEWLKEIQLVDRIRNI